MAQEPKLSPSANDRKILRRVLVLTLPLSLLIILALPNGPVFKAYSVPAESMMPSLPLGSYLIASRWPLGLSRWSYNWIKLPIQGRWPDWQPQRGDIVTFVSPKNPDVEFVKRVIAMPGERVAVTEGRLFINGELIARDAVAAPAAGDSDKVARYIERLPGAGPYMIQEREGDQASSDTFPETRVPDGHVFVMGDNRDNSLDSRHAQSLGPIPLENLIGKIMLIIPPKKPEASS